MDPDVITTWAWVVWLALILIFIIIEVSTLRFTFLMLALSAVAGLVAGLLGAQWWVQLVTAAVFSQLLLFVVRPPLVQRVRRGAEYVPSTIDALVGSDGTVTMPFADRVGQVTLSNGDVWSARLARRVGDVPLAPGSHIVVTAFDGATVVVEPAPESEEDLT